MMPRNRDKEFPDRDFERIADAYANMAEEEPPKLLDQAVLNKARHAVSGKAVRPWNFGWIHALSTAAILVLGIALLVQQREPVPQEPLRVAKPPSAKLRDIPSESRTLQIPAKRTDKLATSRDGQREADQAPLSERREGEITEPRNEVSENLIAAEPAGLPVTADTYAPAQGTTEAATVQDQDGFRPLAEMEGPAEWLERLVELKAAGHQEDFERELAAFRAAWPDFPLPTELTD